MLDAGCLVAIVTGCVLFLFPGHTSHIGRVYARGLFEIRKVGGREDAERPEVRSRASAREHMISEGAIIDDPPASFNHLFLQFMSDCSDFFKKPAFIHCGHLAYHHDTGF